MRKTLFKLILSVVLLACVFTAAVLRHVGNLGQRPIEREEIEACILQEVERPMSFRERREHESAITVFDIAEQEDWLIAGFCYRWDDDGSSYSEPRMGAALFERTKAGKYRLIREQDFSTDYDVARTQVQVGDFRVYLCEDERVKKIHVKVNDQQAFAVELAEPPSMIVYTGNTCVHARGAVTDLRENGEVIAESEAVDGCIWELDKNGDPI